LLGLEPEQIKGQLAQFQAKRTNRPDTLSMLRSINGRLSSVSPAVSLPGAELEAQFDRWWPDLEEKIQTVPEAGATKAPERTDRDILVEVLGLTRELNRRLSSAAKSLRADAPPEGLPKLRAYIRTKKAALAGFMELGAELELEDDVLKVIPRSDIYVRYLSDNKAAISTIASEHYRRAITVEIAPVSESKPRQNV
jgi:hypothetical protein